MLTEAQYNRLTDAGRQVGLAFSGEQLRQIDRTCELLTEWSAQLNLTAIRDVDGIVDKHFIDSFHGHPHLGPQDFVLDIGTGAGFPGIALKIAAPTRRVLMIDGTGKKIHYVQTVLRELGFPPESAMQQRAEDKAFKFALSGQFDAITARAVAKAEKLAAYAAPLLKPGTGKLVLYKGPAEAEEAQDSPLPDFGKPAVERYNLPGGDERTLLIYHRT